MCDGLWFVFVLCCVVFLLLNSGCVICLSFSGILSSVIIMAMSAVTVGLSRFNQISTGWKFVEVVE